MLDFSNIRIILVNTSHPGNIGATARAMKNMGLHRLYLVDPEDFPSGVARGRAVAAVDILENAVVTPTLQEAVQDCGLVIGASARSRRIPWPVLSPAECAARVAGECGVNQVALVLGREDAGLTNEELQLCHFHVQIPADEVYSSLNLAAAALVLCYEVRLALLDRQTQEVDGEVSARARLGSLSTDAAQEGAAAQARKAAEQLSVEAEEQYWDVEKATGQQVEYFYEHLEKVLIDLDFHDPENPRQLMLRMRRLFGRIRPDRMEVSILRGILTHIEFKLAKLPNDIQNPDSND